MKKPVIVMLIGFIPNHRILRRIEVEKLIGDVHLICWDRGSDMLPKPKEEGFIIHIISIDAGSDPIKRYLPTKIFSKKAKVILKQLKPDIIHVQGLDMLQIAAQYKKRHDMKTHIIYEVADLHRYLVDEQKDIVHKAIKKYLLHADRMLEKYYDLLILTSEAYYDVYFKDFVKIEKMLYMANQPDLSIFDSYKKKENGEFTVGYIGGVRYKKQIYNLIEAARACNVKLLIAGFEDEPIELEPLCKADPRIEWIGRFEYKTQAPALYEKCDVMYSVYNADMANVRVAVPNKLYEAVYCEMPIIVAKGTYLANITQKWGVGVAVDHINTADLIKEIKLLQKTNIYNQYVNNCKKIKEKWTNNDINLSFRERLEALIEKK